MKFLFWISLALVIYTYLGYPFAFFVLASVHQVMVDLKFALRRSRNSNELPSVSLIFSAFNEEAVIKDKMSTFVELEYPAPQLEMLIGCDGCTDARAALARQAHIENTVIFYYPIRRGKPVTANDLVDKRCGESRCSSPSVSLRVKKVGNR